MTALNKLKLVFATRANGGNAQLQRRNKLCAKIDEQLALLKAKREGKVFAPTRVHYITDELTGERRAVEKAKRVKEWFWTGADGTLLVQIRYGSKVLALAKDKNTIVVADMDELAKTLAAVKAAVQLGELDAAIDAASHKLRDAFAK